MLGAGAGTTVLGSNGIVTLSEHTPTPLNPPTQQNEIKAVLPASGTGTHTGDTYNSLLCAGKGRIVNGQNLTTSLSRRPGVILQRSICSTGASATSTNTARERKIHALTKASSED